MRLAYRDTYTPTLKSSPSTFPMHAVAIEKLLESQHGACTYPVHYSERLHIQETCTTQQLTVQKLQKSTFHLGRGALESNSYNK